MTSVDPASKQYDLFLSYNRNDSTRATQLAEELEKRGVRVWLDKSNLAPGERWRREIAGALAHAHGVAVLIGPSGLGGWQELEVNAAVTMRPERAHRFIPIPLPGAPRAPTLPDLLAPFMHCDLRADNRAQQVDALAEVLRADRQRTRTTSSTWSGGPEDWLVRLFQCAGKTLVRYEQPSPKPVRAQPEAARQPAGARPLFSAEDADELLQNFGDGNAQTNEVTQEVPIVPSLRERLSS